MTNKRKSKSSVVRAKARRQRQPVPPPVVPKPPSPDTTPAAPPASAAPKPPTPAPSPVVAPKVTPTPAPSPVAPKAPAQWKGWVVLVAVIVGIVFFAASLVNRSRQQVAQATPTAKVAAAAPTVKSTAMPVASATQAPATMAATATQAPTSTSALKTTGTPNVSSSKQMTMTVTLDGKDYVGVVAQPIKWTDWTLANVVIDNAVHVRPSKPFEAAVSPEENTAFQLKTDYLDNDPKTWKAGQLLYKFHIEDGWKPVALGYQGDTKTRICWAREGEKNMVWVQTQNGNGTSALVVFVKTDEMPPKNSLCP